MTRATRMLHAKQDGGSSNIDVAALIRSRFEAHDAVRRGVCLLNAGRFDEAENAFTRAAAHPDTASSLPSYLAACRIGQGDIAASADAYAEVVASDPLSETTCIRYALMLQSSGRREEAIQAIRDGIRMDRECAELHFQLGLLLWEANRYEEAELRFVQAMNIDRAHTDAMVNLALCYAVRGDVADALPYLERAQSRRPRDARIGLLLTQAAKALESERGLVRVHAAMPDGDIDGDSDGVEALSKVIENDPEFVDAFLSIAPGEVDESIFAMLLSTLELALQRRPEHAVLHHHCGLILERLGRCGDAIQRNECAVLINPNLVQALIALGRLYQLTDRRADATVRLEQAIDAGAEYADVYYLLGNLYRDQGRTIHARTAYRRALDLNNDYSVAKSALSNMPC